MKIRYVLCLAVVLVAGCGVGTTGTTGTTSELPAAPSQPEAQRDLLALLPDAAVFPSYLEPVSKPQMLTLETAPASGSTWNGFGTLFPQIEHQPAGCTPVRTPDMAPYAGGPFAWQYYFFAPTSRVLLPTESGLMGSSIGRGKVDETAVRGLASECAVVRSSDGIAARYEVLPNPKTNSAQVLAIKSELGLRGGYFRLTYVAQIDEYIVTTYAMCTVMKTCEKEMAPVFQNAVAKAESA